MPGRHVLVTLMDLLGCAPNARDGQGAVSFADITCQPKAPVVLTR